MRVFGALLSCLLLLGGCNGRSDDDVPEGWLRFNIYTEPPTLDPRMTTDVISFQVLQVTHEPLMRYGSDGRAHPAAAESVDISDDGLTYTFHLRDTVWWDGKPVVAEDFAYTLRTILSPEFPSRNAFNLYIIKNGREVKAGTLPLDQLGISTPNDKTLVIELEHPAPYLLEVAATNLFMPVRRDIDDANPRWHGNAGPDYIGNGPFILDEWHHNDRIILRKNPHYWDRDNVKAPGILMTIIGDPTTELTLFDEGELDWAGSPLSIGLPPDAIPTLKAEGRLYIEPIAGVYFLSLNVENPVLSNKKIRKALALAIDREAIIEHITGTDEIPATGLLPPSLALQEEPYFPYHDPDRAQELFREGMDELGMTVDTMPTLTFSYNTSEAHSRIAQAVQQGWYDAFGFRVRLENLEWKVYLGKLGAGDYDIGRMGRIAVVDDPVGMLEEYKEKHSSNFTNWEHPRFRELIDQANNTLDQEKRRRLLHEAEKLFIDEMPLIPIYYHTNSYLKSPRLRGEVMTPLGLLDLKMAYLEGSADE